MKSSGSLEDFQTGTEIKVVCVSKNYFRLDVFFKVSMLYALARAYRTDRHEDRSIDPSVVSRDDTASGSGLRVIMSLYEFHSKSF